MIKYSSTIEWTKFENASELADFLSSSSWWDREWNGLQYDHEKWVEINDQIMEELQTPKGRQLYFATNIKNTVIKPFWEEQFKQYNYNFPLYFRRDCTYADGHNTCYLCEIGTKEDYIKDIQDKINYYENKITKLKALITEAVK